MRILLVEDDLDLCELIVFALEKEGCTVDVCNEGDDGLRWAEARAHDLILLDRMLPRLSGTELLQRARAAGIRTPVILMTALGSTDEKIEGLDLGADDYLVKPFAVGELLARIRAVGRRPRSWEVSPLVSCRELLLDPSNRQLRYRDRTVSLSKRESALLEFLMKNPGKIIPRHTLLFRVWGPDAGVEEGNLDNYIHLVRQRLRTVASPVDIVTIRQTGYCLGKAEEDESIS